MRVTDEVSLNSAKLIEVPSSFGLRPLHKVILLCEPVRGGGCLPRKLCPSAIGEESILSLEILRLPVSGVQNLLLFVVVQCVFDILQFEDCVLNFVFFELVLGQNRSSHFGSRSFREDAAIHGLHFVILRPGAVGIPRQAHILWHVRFISIG